MIDYHYFRYFQNDIPENDHKVTIKPFGLYVEYRDGRFLDTGIVPSKLFPNQNKLKPKDINKLIRLIKTNKPGLSFSKEQFDQIKKKFESETSLTKSRKKNLNSK